MTAAGVVVVALVVAASAGGSVGFGTGGDSLLLALTVAGYAVTALAFLFWVRAPSSAAAALLLAAAAAATAVHHVDPDGPVVGLYLVTAYAPLRLPARAAAAVAAVAIVGFDAQLARDPGGSAVFLLVVAGGGAFFFLFGTLLRREHEQRTRADRLIAALEASRAAERAGAAAAERARLARELHDVLAHTLSGLAVHLQGTALLARSGGADPELVAALARAHELTRYGIDEARAAVRALRADTPLGPSLIPALVAEHRRSGGGDAAVSIDCPQQGVLPDEVNLALYRGAQEALSNVRAHTPGAAVDLRLCCDAGAATLLVHSTGGLPAAGVSSGGHGLAGIAERVAGLGGRLDAGPADGGFRVELRIPLAGSTA